MFNGTNQRKDVFERFGIAPSGPDGRPTDEEVTKMIAALNYISGNLSELNDK